MGRGANELRTRRPWPESTQMEKGQRACSSHIPSPVVTGLSQWSVQGHKWQDLVMTEGCVWGEGGGKGSRGGGVDSSFGLNGAEYPFSGRQTKQTFAV